MNFKNNAYREIKTMIEDLPAYSLGEVIYSVVRQSGAKSISDIKRLSDEELFTAVEKAIDYEKE